MTDSLALYHKAEFLTLFALINSNEVCEKMARKIDEIEKVSEKTRLKIRTILTSAIILFTQKYIYENRIIIDDNEENIFEKVLYQKLADTLRVDPLDYIDSFVRYVNQKGGSAEASYVGKFICDELGVTGAIETFEINIIYNSWIINVISPFYKERINFPSKLMYGVFQRKISEEHIDLSKDIVSCKCLKYLGRRYIGVVCDVCSTEVKV